MPVPVRRFRLAVGRPLAALAATGALLLLAAGPATAHDHLETSEPTSGASVAAPPSEVVLHLEEAPLAIGTRVQVTGPDGVVSTGDPQLQDDDVVQALRPDAPAGAYTVDWRVTSDDGHPVEGSFTFTAQAAAAGAASSSAPSSAAASASAEPSMTTVAEPSQTPTATSTTTPAASTASGSGGGVSRSTLVWTVVAGLAGAALGLVLRRARSRSKP